VIDFSLDESLELAVRTAQRLAVVVGRSSGP
jgi:hypothetical protein